jgi:hypothetical protein
MSATWHSRDRDGEIEADCMPNITDTREEARVLSPDSPRIPTQTVILLVSYVDHLHLDPAAQPRRREVTSFGDIPPVGCQHYDASRSFFTYRDMSLRMEIELQLTMTDGHAHLPIWDHCHHASGIAPVIPVQAGSTDKLKFGRLSQV